MKTEIEWISVKDRLPECGGKYLFISGKIGESASIVLYHKSTNMFEKYIERIIPLENIHDIMCIPIIIDHDSWWSHLPIPPQNLEKIKKEPKFKVGDRVIIISTSIKGTIDKIDDHCANVKDDHDKYRLYCVPLYNLKKLRPKNKAFKVGDRVNVYVERGIFSKDHPLLNKKFTEIYKATVLQVYGNVLHLKYDLKAPKYYLPGSIQHKDNCKKLRPLKREWKFGDRCIIKDNGCYHGEKGTMINIENLFNDKKAATIKLDIHQNNNDIVWGNLKGLRRLVKKKSHERS